MQYVLVMGVCGTGKSSVAAPLAERLQASFVEADDHHSSDAIARMRRGEPLTDAHRHGWLERVAEAAIAARPAVIACSALKQRYRDRLTEHLGPVAIIHLHGDKEVIAERMTNRKNHFMPASLIESQFADLEPPAGPGVLTVDIRRPLDEILSESSLFLADARHGA